MSKGSEGKIEDDGIDLVQQVLAENPPEERGERKEWAQHVGWHRKEDIYTHTTGSLRGANSVEDANNGSLIAGQQNQNERRYPTKSNTDISTSRQTLITTGCAVISFTCLLLTVFLLRPMLRFLLSSSSSSFLTDTRRSKAR